MHLYYDINKQRKNFFEIYWVNMLNLLVVLLVQKYCTKTLHAIYVYFTLHSWSMHVFDMQIAIHVLHASSATSTRCSLMSCIQIYINAIRIERALSLQIIISFHRNGTFTFFAHMFRCVLRPLLVLTTVFLSTVIFERTLHNLSIALSPSISLAQSAQNLTTVSIGPCFHHHVHLT